MQYSAVLAMLVAAISAGEAERQYYNRDPHPSSTYPVPKEVLEVPVQHNYNAKPYVKEVLPTRDTGVPAHSYFTPPHGQDTTCPDLSKFEHFDTPEYQAQSAYCKQKMIWANVTADLTSQPYFIGPEFNAFFQQNMNLSFDTVSDTMPIGRIKRTHPVGTTTLMEFVAEKNTPYTGIFKGAKYCVMRISEFAETDPAMPHTTPGHAVKFLRDGMASANWFAMFAFDG